MITGREPGPEQRPAPPLSAVEFAPAAISNRPRALLVSDPLRPATVESDLDMSRASAHEALEALERLRPDLLILDGSLPVSALSAIFESVGQPGGSGRPAVLVIADDGRRANVEARFVDHADDFVHGRLGREVVTARIRVALRNRECLAELERKNAELQLLTHRLESLAKRTADELRLASQVQRSLLPPPLHHPDLDFASEFIPVREIGGDYFDLIPLGPHRLAFGLGDVMGKGVPAALLAANLKACLRAQLQGPVVEPAELIGRVNRLFWEVTPKGLFASLFFGVFDLEQGVFEYVNAGHEHPFVVRRDAATRDLETGGTLLGLMEGARFEQARVELDRDDMLVFFSDGITDRSSQDGQFYGVDRLKAAAMRSGADAARLALYSLLGDVQGFSSGTPAEDDMTLIVAKPRHAGLSVSGLPWPPGQRTT
jgi:sigma-B regulation protein RsbU (phosphoserine phosphatase)